jgi:hypothetical protein
MQIIHCVKSSLQPRNFIKRLTVLLEILKLTILPEIKEHKVEIHVPAINCMDIGSTKDAFDMYMS